MPNPSEQSNQSVTWEWQGCFVCSKFIGFVDKKTVVTVVCSDECAEYYDKWLLTERRDG